MFILYNNNNTYDILYSILEQNTSTINRQHITAEVYLAMAASVMECQSSHHISTVFTDINYIIAAKESSCNCQNYQQWQCTYNKMDIFYIHNTGSFYNVTATVIFRPFQRPNYHVCRESEIKASSAFCKKDALPIPKYTFRVTTFQA